MTREEWLALAERAEKATGPDEELDEAIYLTLGQRTPRIAVLDGKPVYLENVRLLTQSIDAITALIERELPGYGWSTAATFSGKADGVVINRMGGRWVDAKAATPALALCGAFCSAMAEKSG